MLGNRETGDEPTKMKAHRVCAQIVRSTWSHFHMLARVTANFCLPGLQILFLPFPASYFNFLLSLFTIISADNERRQQRGSEKTKLPANVDYLIHLEKRMGVDKERAGLVVRDAVIASHPLPPKPN